MLSLLPIGLAQAYASIETGLWFARSAEFLQQPLDSRRCAGCAWSATSMFLVGVGAFTWFMAGLWFGWSYVEESAAIAVTPVDVPDVVGV